MLKFLTIGKLNAISVYCAWVMLLACGLYIAFTMVAESGDDGVLVRLFYGFLVFAAVHVVLAFFVRCPHCGRCLTIQTFKRPHPDSIGNWASVVAKWFSGSIVCIHCGNRVNTNNL
ncbi:MAG: hypothetical protein CL539_01040 [Alcanivorax sp.]|nr:hypothetical protein [Alcanivorax sp.]